MSDKIYKMKLGESVDEDMMGGILKSPVKLVAITYSVMDANGNIMNSSLKTKDCPDDVPDGSTSDDDG